MPLLWQPRAHSLPVPSKACQTSSASCGNSPSIRKQEHPVTVGAVRLDLTQHHLCKSSYPVVGLSPSFTQHVDIIRIPEEIPQVSALVDSDATSSFINQTFVAQHNIHVVKKSTLVLVEVIDGRTIASGAITHEITPLELRIGKHAKKIVLNIISTFHHPVILGLLWLEAHNPIIDWRSKTLTFSTTVHLSKTPSPEKHPIKSCQEPCGQEPKEGRNQFQSCQVCSVKSCNQEPPGGQNQTLSCQESCRKSCPENQPCSDLL